MINILEFGIVLMSFSAAFAENVCFSERCLRNASNVSCHQQIPGASSFSCSVYKDSNVCEELHSSPLKTKQNVNPSEKPFVEPIMFLQSFCDIALKYTGLNITMKIKKNSPYTGLIFRIIQETNGNYSLCRIMDFHSIKFKEMVTVWYDCFLFQSDDTDNRYKLEVTALPTNATEEYKFKIPSRSDIEPESITDWQSTIFLQTHEISNHKLTAFFQQAPPRFKIENYRVLLIVNDTEIVKEEKTVKINNHSTLSKVMFDNIEEGNNYVVAVKPLIDSCLNCTKNKCCISKSYVIDFKKSDKGGYLPYIGAVAVGLLLIFVVVMLIKSRPPRKSSEAENVLVLYSWDCDKHFSVVKAFCEHLSKNCYCPVTVDYKNLFGDNSVSWLAKNIDCNDKIIVIWSKGAEAKVKNFKLPGDPGHLTSKFFCYAVKQLNGHLAREALLFTNNCVCNVFFSYFPKQKVTETLNLLPKFQINNNLNKLLCFLKNGTRQFDCNLLLPKMSGANLQQFSEGKKLLQAIEEMQRFDKENPQWLEAICSFQTNQSIEEEEEEEMPSEHDHFNNACSSTTQEDLSSIQSQQLSLPTDELGFHSIPSTSAEMPSEEHNTYLPSASADGHPYTSANEDMSNIYNPVASELSSSILPLPPSMMIPVGCYPPNMPPFPSFSSPIPIQQLSQPPNNSMPTNMAFPCRMPVQPLHLPNMSLMPTLVPMPIFPGTVCPPMSAMPFPVPTTSDAIPCLLQFCQSPSFPSTEMTENTDTDKTELS